MALYCQGSGSPTVVLDSGLGMDASVWRRVQPELANRTRTCSFDRAGYGASDPGPLPRDTSRIVADLKAALDGANISGPYVLVGHSMAGYNVRLFASTFRSDVAGMVLLDPSIDGNLAPLRAASEGFKRVEAEMDAMAGKCIRAAAAGEMKPGNPVFAECGSPPSDSPMASAAMAQAVLSEQESSDRATDELSRRETHYGQVPIVVLTAGAQYGPTSPYPPEERPALWRVWSQGHAAIAAKSERGVHRVVEGAPHVLQMARPEAVIAAVEEVLAQVR